MPTQKLTTEIITAAIAGFESQKRRIDDQIAELRAMLPGFGYGPTGDLYWESPSLSTVNCVRIFF